MKRFPWLGSMAAQMFLILLVGVLAAAGLAFAGANFERRQTEQRNHIQRLIDRVADLKTALDGAPADLRPDLLGVGPEAPRMVDAATVTGARDQELTRRLTIRLGTKAKAVVFDPAEHACRPPPPQPPRPNGTPEPLQGPAPPPPSSPGGLKPPRPPPPGCRLVAFDLKDQRVALIIPTGPNGPPPEHSPLGPVFLSVLGIAAAALAFLVARLATAPLSRLSRAATALGRDLDRPPLVIEGPAEVREAAVAFNAMQVRLKRHLDERTQMLAAVTHDLQTPLTRHRLRLEKVADPALREQLLADQTAMQEMIHEGLDLARLSSETEPLDVMDVDSLLQALCDDAAAAGWPVTIVGETGLTVQTRPQALKRCLSNLLDNALKYAGSAELSAKAEGGLVIRVRDHGPGIPAEHLETVLQPFFRLESSRSRDSGGVGLGLTIARSLAERSAGRLRLLNSAKGGLDAEVIFPSTPLAGMSPTTVFRPARNRKA